VNGFRELLFGNWRNKGVAMFFAVTIWFVAYQSELQTEPLRLRVELTPKQDDRMVIRLDERGRDGQPVPFSGLVNAKVNGSRKQIEDFRAAIPGRVQVLLDAAGGPELGREYFFNSEDMALPRSPVEIISFEPVSVEIVFDERVDELLTVEPVYPVPEGWETVVAKCDPDTVRVAGPRSILDKIRLVAAPVSIDSEGFGGTVPVEIRHESADGLSVRKLVTLPDTSEVRLTVELRVKQREFSREAVKIRFLVPPLRRSYRIEFEESAVPLKFLGPEGEIQRLEMRIEEDPAFFVAVEVPVYDIPPDREYTFTFTEDKLLIFGFSSEIQKLQHTSREGKGPWQCRIVPVVEKEQQ